MTPDIEGAKRRLAQIVIGSSPYTLYRGAPPPGTPTLKQDIGVILMEVNALQGASKQQDQPMTGFYEDRLQARPVQEQETAMHSPKTYYLPRRFGITSPWSAFIAVRDKASGRALDKIDEVDLDAGTVTFQNWDAKTGGYAPRTEMMEVDVFIAAGAPAEALEWWSIPVGEGKHVEVKR